jgi:hypothetical protein
MGTQNQNPTYCPACGQLECDHFCTACGGPWKFCLGQHYIPPQQQPTNQPPPFIQGATDTVNYLGEAVTFFLLLIFGVGLVIAAVWHQEETTGGWFDGGLTINARFGCLVVGVILLWIWWHVFMHDIVIARGWDKSPVAWKNKQLEIMRREDKGEFTPSMEDTFSWGPTYRRLYRWNHQQPKDKGEGTSYWGPSRK